MNYLHRAQKALDKVIDGGEHRYDEIYATSLMVIAAVMLNEALEKDRPLSEKSSSS